MASIGGITFNRVYGPPDAAPQYRIVPFERPGVSGRGMEVLGTGAGDATYTAVLFTTAATAKTTHTSLAALVGSSVSVVTEAGTTIAGFIITAVDAADPTTAQIPGNTGIQVRQVFTVKGYRNPT